MKNIIAVLGSRKGVESNTYKVTKLILDKVIERSNEIKYEIIMSNKNEIRPCLGCENCFKKGYCVQDDNDSMNDIKKKILEADLIIFGSPVFAHNVSGDMKNFIDRISYWLHVFRLSKKKSVTISVSSGNGNLFVSNYLRYILEVLGTKKVLDINVTISNPNMLKDKEFLEDEILKYSEDIYRELCNDLFVATDQQEEWFKNYKETVLNHSKENYEYLYWEKSGLLKSKTFQQYLLS